MGHPQLSRVYLKRRFPLSCDMEGVTPFFNESVDCGQSQLSGGNFGVMESPLTAHQAIEPLAIEFRLMTKTLESPFRDHFPKYVDGLVRGEPGGFVFTPTYAENAQNIRQFRSKPGDIWITSFPKSGTTWTQEMVWLLANNLDFEGAREILDIRSSFLEFPFIFPKNLIDAVVGANEIQSELNLVPPMSLLDSLPSPRVIKSHLPLYLLPPTLLEEAKVVYVARNPKDVIVSYFYHHKHIRIHEFTRDVAAFAEYFIQDELMFSPYFPHVLEAWNKRNLPNFLFLFYEDLKKDLRGQIQKVANFLGKELTNDQLERLAQHLHFDNFSKNKAVNCEHGKAIGSMTPDGHFIRKGQIGDWKNHFSSDLNQRIDFWIESNLAGSDLSFVTEVTDQQ